MRGKILKLSFIMAVIFGKCWSVNLSAKINVVTSTEDLASIAKEVGGDKVNVVSLAKGYQDPHFVDAKPSYLIKLQKANLFVEIGRDLEVGWVPSLLNSARNPDILPGARGFLDTSIYVPILEMPTGEINRAQGDVHPFGNPHYWLDPKNGEFIADAITEKLSEIASADASYFHARNQDFKKRLESSIVQWELKAKKMNLTGTRVVTYHKSWSYFVKRFGLVIVNFIEPKPGIPPSPQHVQQLETQMKSQSVKLIVVEPYFDIKLPQKIALETNAKLVILPTSVGAEKDVQTYFDLFDRQLQLISESIVKGGQ